MLRGVDAVEVLIAGDHTVTFGIWEADSVVVPFLTDDMPVLIRSLHFETAEPFVVPAADLILQAMTAPVPNGQITAGVNWMIQRLWEDLHPQGVHFTAWDIAERDLREHSWHLAETNGGGLVSRDALDAIAHAG